MLEIFKIFFFTLYFCLASYLMGGENKFVQVTSRMKGIKYLRDIKIASLRCLTKYI